MATTSKKHTRRQGQAQANSKYLMIGAIIVVVGLLGFGMYQVLGSNQNQASSAGVSSASETVAGDSAQPVADRETRFLGPASDPAAVALAEAGQAGQPTLVWFHADW